MPRRRGPDDRQDDRRRPSREPRDRSRSRDPTGRNRRRPTPERPPQTDQEPVRGRRPTDPADRRRAPGAPEPETDPSAGPVDPVSVYVWDTIKSVAVVVLIGALLFGISGVWPPMVVVQSDSMEPNLQRGDLLFVMDDQRLVPDIAVAGTGVVSHDVGADANYQTVGAPGDVIVFEPPDRDGPPIVHRARFWVAEGENWYDKADQSRLRASQCGASPDDHLANCPAPHAGFITMGDANPTYDQVTGLSGPVKPAWIMGTAELRIPWVGNIRLKFNELFRGSSRTPTEPAAG